MIVLLICATSLFGGIYLCHRGDWPDFTIFAVVGFFAALVGGACLLMGLVGVPLERMETHAEIAMFHALGATATAALGVEALEMAAYQMKVAEANQWLASTQYWNGTLFDLWIPDVVDDLEPIR